MRIRAPECIGLFRTGAPAIVCGPPMIRLVLLVLLLLGAALSAAPQSPLDKPLAKDGLDPSAVQLRLDAISKANGLDPALKTRLETGWQELLGQAQQLEEENGKITGFKAVQQNGAKDVAELQGDLQSLPQSYREPRRELPEAEVKQRLTSARQNQAKLQAQLKGLDADGQPSEKRRGELPTEIAKAETALAKAAQERSQAGEGAGPAAALRQSRVLLAEELARARLTRLQLQLETLDEVLALRAARRELWSRQLELARQEIEFLTLQEQQAQREAAAEARRRSRQELLELDKNAHPLLRAALKEIDDINKERSELADKLPRYTHKQTFNEDRLQQLQRNQRSATDLAALQGTSDEVGRLLRDHHRRLAEQGNPEDDLQSQTREIAHLGLRSIQVTDALLQTREDFEQLLIGKLTNPEDLKKLNDRPADFDVRFEARFDERNQALLKLSPLLKNAQRQLESLNGLARKLVDTIGTFRSFLDERILWIRSNQPLWDANWGRGAAQRAHTLDVLREAFLGAWTYLTVGLGVGLCFVPFRRRLRKAIQNQGKKAKKGNATQFGPTLLTLLACLTLALPVPIVLLGFYLGIDDLSLQSAPLGMKTPSLPDATRIAAWSLLACLLFRSMCRPGGLTEAHLGWHKERCALLRWTATWFAAAGVPLLWIAVAMRDIEDRYLVGPGRIAEVAGCLLLSFVLSRLLHPSRGVFAARDGNPPLLRGFTSRLLFGIALLGPIALAGMSIAGYAFAASRIASRIAITCAVVAGYCLITGLITRWQLVTRRRLALAELRRRATEDREKGSGEPSLELDITSISQQARQLIRTVLTLLCAVSLFAAWADLIPALAALDDVVLWRPAESLGTELPPITLLNLLVGILIMFLTVVAARNLPGLLSLTVLQRMRPGNQYAITTITRYLIVVVGIMIAFAQIGVGWSQVQWLVAAVSLGLGFGLQEIFANFVSGIIILFEQPIRVGDFVTVGDINGEVTRIRIRATTVRNLERKELIVPNKQFITGEVINWTLTDTISRVAIHVGIAYGSDVEKAREIMLRVAKEHPQIADDPKPKCIFLRFADSALLFELRTFIRSMDHWPKVMDGLHSGIDREFRKAGIEISFPQRDLHIRTVPRGIDIRKADDEDQSA